VDESNPPHDGNAGDPNPPDAAERAVFNMAYEDGAFADALGAYQRGLILRSLAILKAEGCESAWNEEPPASPYEWTVAMVKALDEFIDREGEENVGYKLQIARNTIAAVGVLQALFEGKFDRPGQGDRKSWDKKDVLSELILQGVRMGGVEMMLGQAEGGLIDEYIALKWDKHQSRESRRRGADATKEAKSQKRNAALEEAQKIVSSNPTLSNDDLAFHLKRKASLPFAIRTLTEWIRAWRADGRLPPVMGR
jgi:hypothetical protein